MVTGLVRLKARRLAHCMNGLVLPANLVKRHAQTAPGFVSTRVKPHGHVESKHGRTRASRIQFGQAGQMFDTGNRKARSAGQSLRVAAGSLRGARGEIQITQSSPSEWRAGILFRQVLQVATRGMDAAASSEEERRRFARFVKAISAKEGHRVGRLRPVEIAGGLGNAPEMEPTDRVAGPLSDRRFEFRQRGRVLTGLEERTGQEGPE